MPLLIDLLIYCVCVLQIPHCLVTLQQSVHAVLIGKTQSPDWLTHGIPQSARMASTLVSLVDARRPAAAETCGTCMTSDGRFIYVHDPLYGLMKIGTGYSNTVMVCPVLISVYILNLLLSDSVVVVVVHLTLVCE